MKYTLICNGDSWTFGCEITDPKLEEKYGDPKVVYRGTYDFFEENIPYRSQRIWPTYIKQFIDCETVNLGWPADDNKTILNRTIDYISSEYIAKGIPTDNIIVIVGWTSPERNSFWWKDDKWDWIFRLWPNVKHFDRPLQEEFWKIYVENMWTEAEFIPRYIMDNLQLQNFCLVNNIKYLMYDSFYQISGKHVNQWKMNIDFLIKKMKNYQYSIDNPESYERIVKMHDWANVWNQIKSPNFYKKGESGNTFNEFIQSKLKNPYIGLHPSPEAHLIWAKELANYLKEYII